MLESKLDFNLHFACSDMSERKCLTYTTTSATVLNTYRYCWTMCNAVERKRISQTAHIVLGADTTADMMRMSPSRALVRFYFKQNYFAFYIHEKKMNDASCLSTSTGEHRRSQDFVCGGALFFLKKS